MKSKRSITTLCISTMVLVLAACGSETEAPVEAVAAGDCPPGITVSDGWLALPAVAGNPAAAYFTITNDNDRSVSIRAVEVIGSDSAMLHETSEWNGAMDMQELFQQPVEAGETLEFAPGGKHAMVFGISDGFEAGGESEVTLTFVGGDKCSFPVTLYPAGTDPREEAEAS